MPNPPETRDPAGLAVLLLVLVTAVPAAVLVLPNTASYVVPSATRDLGLSDGEAAGFVRAMGLALPALLLTTPPAALLARRLPAWGVLFAGLALMLGAQASAAYVTSVPLVGLVRAIQGAGAGAVLPAALLLACARRERRLTTGVWAAGLAGALVFATPAVLVATPATPAMGVPYAGAWRAILHPYWWLGALALVGTGLHALLRLRSVPVPGVPAATRGERVLLLLPVAPSAGFALLAVVTGYDWSPGAQLILAACAIAGLLGLALVGSRGTVTGSPLGYTVVMIAVGLLTMPVTGPLAGLLGGRGVPFGPFAAGAACAALAVLTAMVSSRAAGRGAVTCGYGLAIAAFLAFLAMGTGADRWELSGALGALGTGVGLALGTALRPTEAGPGLFGLTLCVPAVLGGHLVVGPLQVARVGAVVRAGGDTGEALRALTDAYRMWLVGASCVAVVLAAATLWAGRGRGRHGTGLAAAPDASEAALRAG